METQEIFGVVPKKKPKEVFVPTQWKKKRFPAKEQVTVPTPNAQVPVPIAGPDPLQRSQRYPGEGGWQDWQAQPAVDEGPG